MAVLFFPCENCYRSCGGFPSQETPSLWPLWTQSSLTPLSNLTWQSWLGGGYWLRALKHWVIPRMAGTGGTIPDTSTLSKSKKRKKKKFSTTQLKLLEADSLALKQDPSLLWKAIAGKFHHRGKPGFFFYFLQNGEGTCQGWEMKGDGWREPHLFSWNFCMYMITLSLERWRFELPCWSPPVLTTFMEPPVLY